MTTANVLAVIAIVATLAGVWVVYRQLQLLNQQARMQNFAEYTRRYQQIVLNFPEDINGKDFSLLDREDEEYAKVMRYMRAYYDLCFEEWYLHREGLIESKFWTVWIEGIETAVSKSAFQQAWKVMQADTNFGPDFSKFVEDRINSARSNAKQSA